MAKFTFNGANDLEASFEELANLSDSDKMGIIMAGANFLLGKQREMIESLFNKRTGDLVNSLTIREQSGDDGAYANIYLKGKHRGSGTGKRKRKSGRSNGKYSGSNAEVGYILNYGSPRIPASHWLDNANDEASDEFAEVMQAAWNELLEEKGFG